MPPKKTEKKAPLSESTPTGVVVSKASTLISRLTTELAKGSPAGNPLAIPGNSANIKLRGVIPTGSATLDAAIGRGGYPFGRITTIAGGESTGKTTHALHAVANCQKMGGVGMYIDLEQKLDIDYAQALGVNLDALVIANPGYAEKTFELSQRFITGIPREQDIPIVVILDSINACVPKAVFDAEDYETTGGMGASARIFSAALPKLVQALSGRRVAYIAISQPRDKLTNHGAFKEKVSGGAAFKFYSALVIDLKKDRDAKLRDGHRLVATCEKNQVSPPYKQAEYNITWGKGIDHQLSVLEQGAKLGILNTGTSQWMEMPDPKNEGKILKWQGAAGYRKLLAVRPDIFDYIDGAVRAKFGA